MKSNQCYRTKPAQKDPAAAIAAGGVEEEENQSMSKLRGYPFTTDEVRALQSGAKRQFRVPVRPQPPSEESVRRISGSDYSWIPWDNESSRFRVAGPIWAVDQLGGPTEIKSRFKVGEQLQVKSPWSVSYQEDRELAWWLGPKGCGLAFQTHGNPGLKRLGNQSATSMPFWVAAELGLPVIEITSVRAQRLQEISEEDADHEGTWKECNCDEGCGICAKSYVEYFVDAWDSRHKRGERWADNILVWSYSFEVAP